jgi:hypothetical protein
VLFGMIYESFYLPTLQQVGKYAVHKIFSTKYLIDYEEVTP